MRLMVCAVIAFVVALVGCPVPAPAAAPVAYVPRVSQVVTAARLQQLSDAWASHFVKDKFHQVILAYPLTDQRIIAGHVDVRLSAASNVSPTYANVPIEIRVDGVLVRTIYTGYRIVTLVKTPVLTTEKHHGDVLSASDFRTERLPDDGRSPVETAQLVGRMLNADHAAGTVVRYEETSMQMIVTAGAPVVLIVHDGSVALAADVIARTSGGLGETVTVYDENARRMLSGTVTAPSRVELTLPEVANQ